MCCRHKRIRSTFKPNLDCLAYDFVDKFIGSPLLIIYSWQLLWSKWFLLTAFEVSLKYNFHARHEFVSDSKLNPNQERSTD